MHKLAIEESICILISIAFVFFLAFALYSNIMILYTFLILFSSLLSVMIFQDFIKSHNIPPLINRISSYLLWGIMVIFSLGIIASSLSGIYYSLKIIHNV